MNRRIVIIGICLWLVACQTSSPPRKDAEAVGAPVVKPEAVAPESDQAGEHLITTSALLSTETDCNDAKKTPVANFTEQELSPDSVLAGEQFTHHLVYTVCDADPSHIIEGTLYRKIYRGRHLLHSEPKPFSLKPGRWAVNAFIEVPAKSKPGTYTLKTEFIGQVGKHRIKLIKQTKFEIHG